MTRPSFDQSDPHRRPRAERGASGLLGRLLILATSLFAAGCDSFSFSPPRPPELAPKPTTPRTLAAESASSTKTIEVILLPRIEADVEALKTSARLQAGIDKLRIQMAAPPEGAPASAQVELVRKAIVRKPPVLVIEAPNAPDAALIEAVAEARKAGVAVVSIGRSLAGPKPPASDSASASAAERPLILVTHQELKTSAAMLVADAMRAAKNGKLAPDSGAVILVDPTVDALFQDRVDALRDALKSAGVKKIEELPFVRTIKDGETKLVEYLKAHPETTLVFAVDAVGVLAADDATGVLKTDHRYAIAGYTANESSRNMVFMGEYAAIGIFAVDRLVRRSVNVAAGILKGSKMPERDEIEIPVLEAGDSAGLPRLKAVPAEKPMLLQKGGVSTEK